MATRPNLTRDYKASKAAEEAEETAKKAEPKKRQKELLARIRERFKIMVDADEENRRLAREDIKFVNVPGEQWDPNMRKERGSRPCLEFNKLRINGKRVINGIRDNRPQGKVNAVENGDAEGAELRSGLIRNIESMSDIDTITDQCAEYQVDGGFAAMRVDVQYCTDSIWDKEIKVNGFKDPLTSVYCDPNCDDILLRRDAEDWCIPGRMSIAAFKAKYGNAEQVDWEDGELDDDDDWVADETVRIVEYWWKEPHEKELWLIERQNEEGKPEQLTVDMESDEGQLLKAEGVQPIRSRKVKTHKIMMCVASGSAILEGPVRATGTQFPFVPIYGEIKVVDGRVKWWGLHRFAKDAQKSYNTSRTAIDETIAQTPKAQWWATPKQALGLTDSWAEAHRKNFPFMLYNPDAAAQGAPQRMGGPDVPVALMSQSEVASADIRDVTGLHEASFGEESGEKSGVALARKQNQAQIVTYNFADNMAKARKRVGEIILDYIPEVYDADREVRILGADGEADYKRVNHFVMDAKQGKAIRINDLTAGKYDYVVTTGPSFATQRQEFTAMILDMAARSPEVMQIGGDLLWKASDMPYAQELAKRWQTILPPPIQKQLAEGKEIPPEAQAVMAQAEQAMALVQQQTQLVQQAAAEVEQEKSLSDQKKAELKALMADLKAQRAEFDAHVAEVKAEFVQREAQLGMQSQQLSGDKQALDGERKMFQTEAKITQQQNEAETADLSDAKKAVQEIDSMVAQFMELVAEATQKLEGMVAEIKNKPKIKAVHLRRDKTGTRAEPEYEAAPAG
jgi:hypothetical protein